MATLYISEYADLPRDNHGNFVPAAQEPPLAEQTLTIAAASAMSLAFTSTTKYVRLHTDAACSVLFGESPTAVATKKRLAPNSTEYFGVTPEHRVAVITNS
jgi:hypothetical protein